MVHLACPQTKRPQRISHKVYSYQLEPINCIWIAWHAHWPCIICLTPDVSFLMLICLACKIYLFTSQSYQLWTQHSSDTGLNGDTRLIKAMCFVYVLWTNGIALLMVVLYPWLYICPCRLYTRWFPRKIESYQTPCRPIIRHARKITFLVHWTHKVNDGSPNYTRKPVANGSATVRTSDRSINTW